MSPEQGAECALWASLSPVISEKPADYQGCYLRQPDDSVSVMSVVTARRKANARIHVKLGTESSQAQDERLAVNLWNLSKQVIQDKTGFKIDY